MLGIKINPEVQLSLTPKTVKVNFISSRFIIWTVSHLFIILEKLRSYHIPPWAKNRYFGFIRVSFGFIRFHSISFDFIRFHSVSFGFIRFHSISFILWPFITTLRKFNSYKFNFIHFHSILFVTLWFNSYFTFPFM